MVDLHSPVETTRRRLALPLIAVSPLLVAFLGSLWVVAGWTAGTDPFWPNPDLTVSEAAGLANAGELVRLITVERMDPNQRWPVRQGIFGEPRMLTPLEAAIGTRRLDIVQLVLQHAEAPTGAARDQLICHAVRVNAPDDVLKLLLDAGDRSDPRATCPPPERD